VVVGHERPAEPVRAAVQRRAGHSRVAHRGRPPERDEPVLYLPGDRVALRYPGIPVGWLDAPEGCAVELEEIGDQVCAPDCADPDLARARVHAEDIEQLSVRIGATPEAGDLAGARLPQAVEGGERRGKLGVHR
jgi:hypothetical protein